MPMATAFVTSDVVSSAKVTDQGDCAVFPKTASVTGHAVLQVVSGGFTFAVISGGSGYTDGEYNVSFVFQKLLVDLTLNCSIAIRLVFLSITLFFLCSVVIRLLYVYWFYKIHH